ncbi:MAG: hypothetical protein LQ350_004409 [Teloschistes chrysophthalmus]|nr:MAG: hypothetical protein LQ350_004409 [Niorma chrysophthalma]
MIFTFETLMRLDNGNPWAFRCSLNACVKTYGANISESTLEEHVLDTQPVLYDQRSEGYILATDRTLRKGVWNDCKSTNLRTNTNSIAYHFSTDPSPNYGSTFSGQDEPKYDNGSFQFYPPNCLWSYSYNAAYALEAALRRQFFNVRNLTTVHDDFYALQTIDPAWLVKLYNGGRANWDCKSIYGRSRGGHYRQHAGEGRAVAEWECRGYDSWIADLNKETDRNLFMRPSPQSEPPEILARSTALESNPAAE